MAQWRHLLDAVNCYKTKVASIRESSICRSASSGPRVRRCKVAHRPVLKVTQFSPHPWGCCLGARQVVWAYTEPERHR